MKKTTHQPHNNLFGMVMSLTTEAEIFIKNFSEELRGKIKEKSYQLKSAPNIDDDLNPHIPDVIHLVEYNGMEAYLYLLFEHKSQYEMPDIQLGRYVWIGYHEQKRAWIQENKTQRKRKKNALGAFVPRLILPIVVYHGIEEWRNQEFSSLFNLTDESLRAYIPKIKYILINLSDYPDKFIEAIESKLLAGVLLLLKHKGDKEFIKKNTKKIFNFVEEDPNSHQTDSFIKTMVNYIYQTFHLKPEEVQEMIEDIPQKVQKDMASTWDILIQKGKAEGMAEGKAEGKAEGIEIGEAIGEAKGEVKGIQIGESIGILETELKKNLETTLALLKKVPDWSNQEIAEIAKVEVDFIEKVKEVFIKKEEKMIIEYLHHLYQEVPKMTDEKWEKVEKWGLDLWKEYHSIEEEKA